VWKRENENNRITEKVTI